MSISLSCWLIGPHVNSRRKPPIDFIFGTHDKCFQIGKIIWKLFSIRSENRPYALLTISHWPSSEKSLVRLAFKIYPQQLKYSCVTQHMLSVGASRLNFSLNKVYTWSLINDLFINPTKSKLIATSNRIHNIWYEIPVKVGDQNI